jgi:hypothetical protein
MEEGREPFQVVDLRFWIKTCPMKSCRKGPTSPFAEELGLGAEKKGTSSVVPLNPLTAYETSQV